MHDGIPPPRPGTPLDQVPPLGPGTPHGPDTPPGTEHAGDTVNTRAVRILLEYNLVVISEDKEHRRQTQNVSIYLSIFRDFQKHTFGLGEYVVDVIVQVETCSGCCSV